MFFFFFNDTATTEIYTLSLHDALPISCRGAGPAQPTTSARASPQLSGITRGRRSLDRKSTRLNSSHSQISYAVFCLKKKNSCSMASFRQAISVEKMPVTLSHLEVLARV